MMPVANFFVDSHSIDLQGRLAAKGQNADHVTVGD